MSNAADSTLAAPRSSVSLWLQAVRAFSFPASVVPVLLGGLFALTAPGLRHWWLLPFAVLGGLVLHAGTNLVNDYFDFEKGVDCEGSHGSSGILVAGLLPPRAILRAGLLCFAITAALGVPIVAVQGWPVVILGAVGLLGSYLYTGRPVAYKYLALGDLLVFVLMGPLMVIGGYLAVTGTWTREVLVLSLPVGCLVAAILAANNLRDREHDGEAGVTTVARLLGHRGGQVEYALLVTSAYGIVAVLAATGVLSRYTLLALLSLPVGLKVLAKVLRSRPGHTEDLVQADVMTAQLHLLFGLLLTLGVVIGALTA